MNLFVISLLLALNATDAAITVDQILSRYEAALGPQAKSVTSLRARGAIEIVNIGVKGTTEIYLASPSKRAAVANFPGLGLMRTVFDGEKGWAQSPGTGAERVSGPALARMRRDSALLRPEQLKRVYSALTVSADKSAEYQEYVLIATPAGGRPDRLHFDPGSGLLTRIETWTQEGLPQEFEFDDYRETGGLKYPFTVREYTPVYRTTTRLSSVEVNVPVGEEVFAK